MFLHYKMKKNWLPSAAGKRHALFAYYIFRDLKKIQLNGTYESNSSRKKPANQQRPLRSLKNRGPQLEKNHHYFSETRMDGRGYFGMGFSKLPNSRANSPYFTQSSKKVRKRRIGTERDVGTQLPIMWFLLPKNAWKQISLSMPNEWTPTTYLTVSSEAFSVFHFISHLSLTMTSVQKYHGKACWDAQIYLCVPVIILYIISHYGWHIFRWVK